MLYPPNTIKWAKGNIVIHWCDAKEPKMLMRVIGYTRDGLIKTQYIDKQHKRTVWINDLKNLLDPRDFGLKAQDLSQEFIERYQRNWVMVRRWNARHPEPGVAVLIPGRDGNAVETRTITKALMQGYEAWVYIENGAGWIGGAWELEAVGDVPAPEPSMLTEPVAP
jgi:hypothetical protein